MSKNFEQEINHKILHGINGLGTSIVNNIELISSTFAPRKENLFRLFHFLPYRRQLTQLKLANGLFNVKALNTDILEINKNK